MSNHPVRDAWDLGSHPGISHAEETYFCLVVESATGITARSLDRTRLVLLAQAGAYSIYQYDPTCTEAEDGVTVIKDSEDRPFVRIATSNPAGGFTPRGAYSGATTYELLDLVINQNSSWVYINAAPGAGNAPPTLPTQANAHWQIVAQQGSGGPAGATGPGYIGTSGTSLSVGATTPISFTTNTGLAYSAGARYRLNKSDDAETFVEGVCNSYDPTTGAFTGTVEYFKGSGTVNSWNLNLIGQPGRGYAATSTTSLAIGIGAKNVTTQVNLAYSAGARVRLSPVGNPGWMEGLVTSYSQTTGALVVSVDKFNNSGTFTSWNINLAGNLGAGVDGADGASALTRVRVVDVGEGDPATDYEAGDSIDGRELAENDLVLRATVGGDPADGVYPVPASGAATRHTGFDAYADFAAAEFNVMEGDDYAGTKWRCLSPKAGTLDSDDLTFEQVLSMDGSNNLSELTDPSAARTNLELGDLATMNQSELADPVAMAIVFGS